jgi:hypothetical protein
MLGAGNQFLHFPPHFLSLLQKVGPLSQDANISTVGLTTPTVLNSETTAEGKFSISRLGSITKLTII